MMTPVTIRPSWDQRTFSTRRVTTIPAMRFHHTAPGRTVITRRRAGRYGRGRLPHLQTVVGRRHRWSERPATATPGPGYLDGV